MLQAARTTAPQPASSLSLHQSTQRRTQSGKGGVGDSTATYSAATGTVPVPTRTGNVAPPSLPATSPRDATVAQGNAQQPLIMMIQQNGQMVTLMVDPNTLKVLNSDPNSPIFSLPPTSATSGGADVAAVALGASTVLKKARKGGNARICPKPRSKCSGKSSAVVKTLATAVAVPAAGFHLSDATVASCSGSSSASPLLVSGKPLWIDATSSGFCTSGCAPDHIGAVNVALATAAKDVSDPMMHASRAIFQTEVISPPLMCSPSNDDNPLLIDEAGYEQHGYSRLPAKGLTSRALPGDRCRLTGVSPSDGSNKVSPGLLTTERRGAESDAPGSACLSNVAGTPTSSHRRFSATASTPAGLPESTDPEGAHFRRQDDLPQSKRCDASTSSPYSVSSGRMLSVVRSCSRFLCLILSCFVGHWAVSFTPLPSSITVYCGVYFVYLR